MILLALAGCDQKPIVSPVLVLDPSPAMAHQIGHLDAAGPALVAVPGEKGFLTFGPYAELAPGLYRVVFDLSITGAGGVAGRVDVNAFTTSQPEGLVESTSIGNGSDQKVSLDFHGPGRRPIRVPGDLQWDRDDAIARHHRQETSMKESS